MKTARVRCSRLTAYSSLSWGFLLPTVTNGEIIAQTLDLSIRGRSIQGTRCTRLPSLSLIDRVQI
jgi:hypothetical protein